MDQFHTATMTTKLVSVLKKIAKNVAIVPIEKSPRTKLSKRRKYGFERCKIKATRIFTRGSMPHFTSRGIDTRVVIAVNDNTQTFTCVNIFAKPGFKIADGFGYAGRNFEAQSTTHKFPAEGIERRIEKWAKMGYSRTRNVFDLGGIVTLR